MKKKILFTLVALLSLSTARADEGMWMITSLTERTDSILHSMGLELAHDDIFSTEHASLNHAIVQFGGFCSGVVVSPDGLVFTNHHCGYGSIQEHSSTQHDYLTDGFFAKKQADELPNEDLYVDFHLNTYEVTKQVLSAVTPDMDEGQRARAIDSVATALQEAVSLPLQGIHAVVTPYYKGSKYYLSVYQRFSDVRLVFAPPQCLGKHGGDTDNWMWPRQTCDFSVFRIYADKNNMPAEYSKDNRPYHPLRYAHVSTQGYQPGSFCMTFGYPGSTDRYLSSFGVENTMRTTNDLRIQVRGVKQAIMKEAMNSSDALRIMYSSKYAQSSNYWKFSIGQNKALEDLGVIAEKQALERELVAWRPELQTLLDSLRDTYAQDRDRAYTQTLWEESFWSGSDIIKFIVQHMMQGTVDEPGAFHKDIDKAYKDIDVETDRRIFTALLRNYREQVPSADYLPEIYTAVIDSVLGGDYDTFTRRMYENSAFSDPERLRQYGTLQDLVNDPLLNVTIDLIGALYKTFGSDTADELERQLGDALRQMNSDKEYYPDANFTLRMSYGQVLGLDSNPCFTPSKSILDKYELTPKNPDYELTEPVLKWLKKGRWGQRYVDAHSGDLQLCFLTTNDITGGNSGSGMFDGRGRLIGLAFDGNWEAMSGDIKFDRRLQRTIGVDIRYVLSVIEQYGGGRRLIEELTLE